MTRTTQQANQQFWSLCRLTRTTQQANHAPSPSVSTVPSFPLPPRRLSRGLPLDWSRGGPRRLPSPAPSQIERRATDLSFPRSLPSLILFRASLRDDLARLERTTIRLLSQRHLVFVVNSGWVCSARLFICSRKESGWIETVIRLLLSRRGYRFELRSFDPADWSGVYSPSIRRATSFAFRA